MHENLQVHGYLKTTKKLLELTKMNLKQITVLTFGVFRLIGSYIEWFDLLILHSVWNLVNLPSPTHGRKCETIQYDRYFFLIPLVHMKIEKAYTEHYCIKNH